MVNKRVLTVFVTVLMLLNIISPIYGDSFNPSITIRPSEELKPRNEDETVTIEDGISILTYKELDECTTTVILTPFESINYAEQEIRENLNTANSIIRSLIESGKTLDELTSDVAIEARKKGVTVNNLVARDIFDITKKYSPGPHHYDPDHDVEGIKDIIIKTKTLKNFVCLLHYKEGSWYVVPDVEILDDTTLKVSVESLSPFVIVISNVDINPQPIEEKTKKEEATVINQEETGKQDTTQEEIVEPIEPTVPVTPNTPIKDDDGEMQGCCIYHILIFITMLLTIIIGIIVRIRRQDDDMDKEELEDLIKRNKKYKKLRYLIMLINLIICVIFYILGTCHLDIKALNLDILMLILFFMFTNKDSDREEK